MQWNPPYRGHMAEKFADPIKIKTQRPKDQPKDGKNTPWDFRCPQYDQRSSVFVNAGTDYGVGHRQPVGNIGNPKARASTLPMESKRIMLNEEA